MKSYKYEGRSKSYFFEVLTFLVNHQPEHPLGEHGADDAEYLGGGVEETAGRALRLGIRDLRRELKANR